MVRPRQHPELVVARLGHQIVIPHVSRHPQWSDGIAQPPDQRCLHRQHGQAFQPPLLVRGTLHQILDGAVHGGHSVVIGERLRQCGNRRILDAARWGEHAPPQPDRQHLRSHRVQCRRSLRIQQHALVIGEIRQRQKDVAVAEHQVGHLDVELTGRASDGETQGHAVATIMSDHRTGACPEDLRQVVPEEFTVTAQCVILARRLVGESESGEIEHAYPVGCAEFARNVAPVDAAGRKAMHHQQ